MPFDDLFPPLELCREIPEEKFQSSAFRYRFFAQPWESVPRWQVEKRYAMPEKVDVFPAPTLEEILSELSGYTYFPTVFFRNDRDWIASCDTSKNPAMCEISEAKSSTGASTAALLLWLNLHGKAVTE